MRWLPRAPSSDGAPSLHRLPSRPRRRVTWPWVIVLVACVELVGHFVFARAMPDIASYDRLEDPLASRARAGDALIVSPRWAEPMVRKALGERGLEMVAPSLDHTSVIEVSVNGRRSERHANWVVTQSRDVGPFALRRLRRPNGVTPITNFVKRFADADDVTVHAGAEPCRYNRLARPVAGGLGGHPTFPSQRFECPRLPQIAVGVTVIADERWRPRRCILAHPPPSGELVVRFAQVPLGGRIVGHAGLDWMLERARRGAPISMRVIVDGRELLTNIHADGDGWARFEASVPNGDHRLHDVAFAIASPGTRARHFCFEARSE